MKIINIGNGKKIDFVVTNTQITFGDELMLNLKKYEKDEPNNIDICVDYLGNLVMGVIPNVAEKYVVQIEIPGRKYKIETVEIGEEEKKTSLSESEEENLQKTKEVKIPIDFDIEKCTLKLWDLN